MDIIILLHLNIIVVTSALRRTEALLRGRDRETRAERRTDLARVGNLAAVVEEAPLAVRRDAVLLEVGLELDIDDNVGGSLKALTTKTELCYN
jgi:hypothetical protein